MTEHQLARKERAENRAAAAQRTAALHFDRASQVADGIPMGQPILVGHHSEKGHRRDLARIDSNMRKGCEATKEAERLQWSALAAGRAISSDDPEALDALQEKLDKLRKAHAQNVAINKLVRKNDRDGLLAMGLGAGTVDKLFEPVYGRVGIPAYVLTNSNANIKRVEARIAELEARAQAAPRETVEGEGWTMYEDRDENRVCVEFDERTSREQHAKMRSAGFVFSRTLNRYQRQLTTQGWYRGLAALGYTHEAIMEALK